MNWLLSNSFASGNGEKCGELRHLRQGRQQGNEAYRQKAEGKDGLKS